MHWIYAAAFNDGPPAGACNALSPNPTAHGAMPQDGIPPFTINMASLAMTVNGTMIYGYQPGVTYTLTSESVHAAAVT